MKFSKRHLSIVTICLLAIFLLAVVLVGAFGRGHRPSSDEVEAKEQIALIRRLAGKNTPLLFSPEFLILGEGKVDGLSTVAPGKAESEAALGSPSFFSSLHREKHFTSILLAPAQASSPLCTYLLESPLWSLKEVTPWGYLFLPVGSGEWIPPSEEEIIRNHPDPTLRAQWLIGSASNLIAIKRTKQAEQLLLEAGKTNRLPSLLLSAQASLAASRGRWNEALTLSRQALSKNSSNITARIILVRALIECGKPDEAFSEAKKLRSLTLTRNTEALFLLARAANAANDKNEEIQALREMISLAREHHQPLGASLTYLGQAYAQNGERGMAMRTFEEALAAPELTEEQREMIRQLIAHLKPEPACQSGR